MDYPTSTLIENQNRFTKEIDTIKKDISDVKQDVAKFGVLIDRLDVTIDRLTDISANVSNLLAVHETKLSSQEITNQLAQSKVDTVETKIENTVGMIDSKIGELRDDRKAENEKLDARFAKIERWMYIAIGAITGLSFLETLDILRPFIS